MISRTSRNAGLLAWTVGAILTLAVAAGASAVVPQLISSQETPAAVSSADVDVSAGAATDAAAATPEPAPEAAIPEVVVPEVEVPETQVVVAPKVTPKAAAQSSVVVEAPAPDPVPVPVVPATPALPVLAPRTVPSDAQVQSVIAGMKSQIPLLGLVSVTVAQVADIGNQVCTGFDQGKTFAQVKALGLAQVPAFVTVSASAAEYAVRNAVSMYCPAYASKLV